MPTPPTPADVSRVRKVMIEQVLSEGFAPPGASGAGRGSAILEAARRLNMDNGTLNAWAKAQARRRIAGGDHHEPDWSLRGAPIKPRVRVAAGRAAPKARPAPVGVRRWLLTAAQDDTPVHMAFWTNLQAYAAHTGAEIMVGGFTYQKGLFQDHASRTAVFASAVQPYLHHDNVELGPNLVFCAKMNTLPTAVRPLSGLETYTRGRWGIFPHAKIQLVSVPALKGHPAMQMTTGACTLKNFIEKKAGLVAEFHYCLGATLVEMDSAGRMFCRQINAADDGSFQDLTFKVAGQIVTDGHRVEAITWGDIHLARLDRQVGRTCWGYDVDTGCAAPGDTILDILRPRHQAIHDLLDFRPRNHHRRRDPHFAFSVHLQGAESVKAEVDATSAFLRRTSRPWCQSVVVPSNHHDALPRWLREVDGREDPPNAAFWLRCNLAVYEAIERGEPDFDVFAWAARQADPLQDITFLGRNGSYVVCPEQGGGIALGSHGHLGPNGARGSAANLVKVATKMNVGHAHTASILDGVYTAGLSGELDLGYNDGPSGWSHSHVVVYENGKRTLLTLQDGHWRA